MFSGWYMNHYKICNVCMRSKSRVKPEMFCHGQQKYVLLRVNYQTFISKDYQFT